MKYWLVQRVQYNSWADKPAEEIKTPLQALAAAGGFGGGKIFGGPYTLDYMGSAEFEFGAIPAAKKRLAEGQLVLDREKELFGHKLDFVYRKQDGEPYEDWSKWVEGSENRGHFKGFKCWGKESAFDLAARLFEDDPSEFHMRTAFWWALDENVIWGFSEDGHLIKWLKSIGILDE